MKKATFIAAILLWGGCQSLPPEPMQSGKANTLMLYADSVQGQRTGSIRQGDEVLISLEEIPGMGKWTTVNPEDGFTVVQESQKQQGALHYHVFRVKVTQSGEITFSNPDDGGRLETFQVNISH